jgi:hypothetical protein
VRRWSDTKLSRSRLAQGRALHSLQSGRYHCELQAIGGYSSISELQKYIQEIEQDEQTASAMAKVAAAQAKERTGSD